MQIRSGKAGEIWSRAVTSCTQMVDTQGAVPDRSNSHFVSNRPWCTMNDGWYWLCLANALASSPRTDSTRKGFEIPRRALPPVCLPSVYLT